MSTTKILFEVEEATKVKAQEKAKKDGISLTAILVNALRSYNAGELDIGLRGPMIKHIEKHARKLKKTSWKDYVPEVLRRVGAQELQTLNTIKIDSEQLLQNYRYLSEASHKTLFPALKSNAYGHGLEQVASILMQEGPTYYYVDSYYEALRIREVDQNARVLVGGYISQNNVGKIQFEWVTPIVSDLQSLKSLASQAKDVTIHIKVDTGMRRSGFMISELEEVIRILSESKNINLEGVSTHFADADNHDPSTTNDQIDHFIQAIQQVHNAGFSPKFTHLSNSAGIFKESVGNAARPGISLYGINPLTQFDLHSSHYNPLSPALRVSTRVVSIKSVERGDSISYNYTHEVQNPGKVATVPFGYHEGLPRTLSNAGYLSKRGKKLPILGRVCMNHAVLDISQCPGIALEDEITVISGAKDGMSSIYDMADQQGTIPYEVYTSLDSSIRRVIV